MAFYPDKSIVDMQAARASLPNEADDLRLRYFLNLSRLKTEAGRDIATMGFLRRLRPILRAVDQAFTVAPLSRETLLSEEERTDLEINLQAFMVHVSGGLDNLAEMWVHEKGVTDRGKPLKQSRIGLAPSYTVVRESLPDPIKQRLSDFNNWYEFQADFRNGVAHRLPLYVPPYGVRPKDIDTHYRLDVEMNRATARRQFDERERLKAQQGKLGFYSPTMGHRPGSASLVIHPTLIASTRTVLDLGNLFADQLFGPA